MANTYNYITKSKTTDWSRPQWRRPQSTSWHKSDDRNSNVPKSIRRPIRTYEDLLKSGRSFASVLDDEIREGAERADKLGTRYAETDLHRDLRHKFDFFDTRKRDPIQREEDEYWQKREDEEKRLKEAAEKAEREEFEKQRQLADEQYAKDFSKSYGKVTMPGYYGVGGTAGNALGFLIKDMIGSGVEKANMAYLSSTVGKIQNDDKIIDLANAQQLDLDLRNQFDLLKDVRANATDKAQVDDAERRMLEIGKLLDDPEHRRRVDAYKLLAVHNQMGFGEKLSRGINALLNPLKNDPDLVARQQYVQRQHDLARYNASQISLANGAELEDKSLNEKINAYNRLSREEQYVTATKALNNVKKAAAEERAEYLHDYTNGVEFQQDAQKYLKASKSYQMYEQLYQDASILNPMYWLYVMPGTIGSSNSSPDQLLATGMQYGGAAAGALMAPFTGGTSAAIAANVGTVASIPYQIRGALDENWAEAGDKYVSNIRAILSNPSVAGTSGLKDIAEDLSAKSKAYWKSLGKPDAWINEHCDVSTEQGLNNVIQDAVVGLPGVTSNDPRFKKAQLDAKLGLEALRQADNMRTMASLPVQIGASIMPVGNVLNKARGLVKAGVDKAAGRVLGREFATEITTDAAGNIAARSSARTAARHQAEEAAGKYKNGFRKKTASETWSSGYGVGADLADAAGLGYAGRIVAGTAAGTAALGARLGKQLLNKRSRQFVDAVQEQLMHKYQNIYDKLLPQSEFKRYALKYGLNYGKAQFVTAMSEGSEEGVQFLNSLENYADKYGYNGMSFGDLVINDLKQGGRVANAYLSLLGIGNSEMKDNAEFWNNVKGGFALGGGHSGIVRLAGDTQGAFREYETNQLLVNSSVFNREASAISRANNRAVAEAIARGDSHYVRNILNDMREADRRRENPYFSEDDYDARLDDVDAIESAINNKHITGVLEAKGIKKGSHEFNTAIADIYNLQQQYSLNIAQLRDVTTQLNQLYSDKALHNDIKRLVEEQVGGFVGYADPNAGHQYDEEVNFGYTPTDDAVQGEDALAYNQNERGVQHSGVGYNPNAAVREHHARPARIETTRLANKLRALLLVKAKINTADNWFDMLSSKFNLKTLRPDAKNVRDNVNEQIKAVREQLAGAIYDSSLTDSKLTDAQLLSRLDALDGDLVSNKNRDAIVEAEVTNALLLADRAVTAKYLNQFSYGVVESEDGKSYEYNPLEYKHQRSEDRKRAIAEAKGEEYKPAPHTREKAISHENDTYAKRVKAIIEADERNAKLDWMVGDIYAGDVASKLEDVDDSQIQSEVTQPDTTAAPSTEDTSSSTSQNVARRLGANRQKYLRRVAKARKVYRDTINKYKNWKRGTMSAMVFPFDDAVVKALGGVIEAAAIGVYKFDEFVSDVKDVMRSDYKPSFLGALRYLYLKKTAAVIASDPKRASDFSSFDEIHINQTPVVEPTPVESPQPAVTEAEQVELSKSIYTEITDRLDLDNRYVVPEVSNWYFTFVNRDGKVTIYKQYRFDDFDKSPVKDNTIYKHIVETLGKAKNKEDFARLLNQLQGEYASNDYYSLNFAAYAPYYGVSGIEEAVATSFVRSNRPQSVLNGQLVRDAVVDYLVSGDESHLQNVSLIKDSAEKSLDITQFVDHAKQLRAVFEMMGYRAVKTNQIIYGTVNGENIASQADVVLVNENNGSIAVYDVATSYMSITDGLDSPIFNGSTITRRDRYNSTNTGTIQILQEKFNYNVAYCGVLPVQLDTRWRTFVFEDTIQLNTSDINTRHYENEDNLVDAQRLLDNTITEYNSLVDEYNLLLDQHPELTGYSKMSLDSTLTVTDTIQAREAISNYSQKAAVLRDNIDAINSKIEQQIDSENNQEQIEPWVEDAQLELERERSLPEDIKELEYECSVLDGLLHNLTVITTKQEKAFVDSVQNQLYKAGAALNAVFMNPAIDASAVQQECLLIASAAEQLRRVGIESKYPTLVEEYIGQLMHIPSGTVSNQGGDVAISALNKVIAWNKTFEQIFDQYSNLDSDELARTWYGVVLNKYYKPLLDETVVAVNNADPDAAVQTALHQIMDEGNSIINQFNERYDHIDDSVFKGEASTDVETINRMPVAYRDRRGNWSTSVQPSRFSMHDGQYGKTWYNWSNKPDLLTQGQFTFDIRNGELVLVCKYNGLTVYLNFKADENDPNIGEQFREERRQYNNNVRPFVEKVTKMVDVVRSNPNRYTIDIVLRRSPISFRFNSRPSGLLARTSSFINKVSSFVMRDNYNQHNLFTIQVSAKDGIGVVSSTKSPVDGSLSLEAKTGPNLGESLFITKGSENANVTPGSLVYKYDSGYEEYGSNQSSRYRLVQLSQLTFDRATATNLSTMLYELASGRGAVVMNKESYDADVVKGIVDLCLYTQMSEGSNADNSFVAVQNGSVTIGGEQYNINDLTSQSRMLEKLQKIGYCLDVNTLNKNLNDVAKENAAVGYVKTLFNENVGLQSITLPVGLTFTREDFEHNNGDRAQAGSTLLGFYLRNGVVGSSIKGVQTTHINIDDVTLVDKSIDNQESTLPQDIERSQQQKQADEQQAFWNSFDQSEDSSQESSDGALFMRGNEVARTDEEVSEFMNSCNKYAERVLGKGVKFGFGLIDSKYSAQMNQNERVLGMCTATTIELSKYAPETTPYHEAFHKILELYLTSDERNKFYEAYRKRYHAEDESERDVAEGLADMFTDYMQHKLDLKHEKGLRKLIPFFKFVGFNVGLLYKLRGDYSAFKHFWKGINAGKFANRPITKEQNDRFNRLFGEGLYYTVTNHDTKEVANLSQFSTSAQIHQMADACAYIILTGAKATQAVPAVDEIVINGMTPRSFDSKLVNTLCGEGKPENELTLLNRQWREILLVEKRTTKTGKNKGYTYNYYPNFAAISSIISAHVLGVLRAHDTSTYVTSDQLKASAETDDKAMGANIDRYDRAAYEFSKLDSAGAQVKMFFATIPYCVFDKDAKDEFVWKYDLSRSPYSVPTFMPMSFVYNVAVDEFGAAQSPELLLSMMEAVKHKDPLHLRLYQKYLHLCRARYKTLPGGERVVDYNTEQLLINVFKAIKSQKIDFTMCKSERDSATGNKTTRIINSAFDKDAATFPKQWSSFLLDGLTGVADTSRDAYGHVKIKNEYKNVFKFTATFLSDLREKLAERNSTIVVSRRTYDMEKPDQVVALKNRIVAGLNLLGIQMSVDSLDYMLSKKYGDVLAEGLRKWLSDGDSKSNINTFISLLSSVYDNKTGRVSEDFEKYGYSRIGFVKELANWLGSYNRQRNELMTNGVDLTKLYTVSQNHAISTAISSVNGRNEQDPLFTSMMSFNYNLLHGEAGQLVGSFILKNAYVDGAEKKFSIKLHTYLGFRTDNRNDFGVKYNEAPEVEDYIGKLSLLQDGAIIPGTLADKGTWPYFTIDDKTGNQVRVPGLRYISDGKGNMRVVDGPKIMFVGKEAFLVPNDAVLNQMIEYAKCELAAIEKCIDDLKTMPDSERTANYYAKRKDGVEPNGTRFWHLCSLTLPVYENGKLVGTKVVNLNDPRKKSAELVELAKENFFNKPVVEQMLIMALTLWEQNKAEVQKAVDLGIIKRIDVGYQQGSVSEQYAKSTDDVLTNLDNVHLDENQIAALQAYLMAERSKIQNEPNGPRKAALIKMVRSMAIAALLGDVNLRSIISEQECERMFIGHPGFFKTKYDMKNGVIVDQCSDKQKRVGSLVSTGDDNVMLPGIPTHYTCAECADYEIKSTADIAKDVRKMFYESELRHVYIKYAQSELGVGLREAEKTAFSMTVEDVEKALSDTKLLGKVNENADKYASSLLGESGKINVADGASYITEDMCKNLLRMNGLFSEDVRKAFELLEDDNSNWQSKKEATDLIYNKVAIVTTKYTAYGFRTHAITGVAVPYLNKFALFPLFKCNATGKLRYIYDQMHEQGVDNLLMTSAVKIGSLGAISFDGNVLSGKFNTYTQPYMALRKQLKTDPEEGDKIAMGTQMVKKVLSNLIVGRDNYVFTHSEDGLPVTLTVTGEWLRDRFMGNIEKIRQFGEKTLRERFFTNGVVDVEKLSSYLHQQLTARNADTIVLRAMDVVTEDGLKKLALPMAATPDSHWIESILISTTNKHVIDITTPGNSFVQRSVFGMDGHYTKDNIVGQTTYGGKKLQMVNEDKSMDAVISIDYFKNILPEGLSFNEARQWLLDNKIIGDDATANTIGYRIPTQAQSSIHALRFVDVVLATQATIILPEEFTKITGSDFDIDHLYLASYNYHKDEDGKITTEYKDDVSEYYQNSLIDCMMTLLKDVDNSFTELFKSIDNDTELVKSVADQLAGPKSVQNMPYVYGGLWEQVTRKNDYINGKDGIGPFALNTPSHVMTSLYSVKFKDSPFTRGTKIGRLDNIFDSDYNYIDAWLSAFINANVDIVKDPYISKLNTNKTTYNHLNLLVRSGYGEAALWFLSHPVIRKISEIDKKFSSKFAKDFDYKKTKEEALLEALTPLIGTLTESDVQLLIDPKKQGARAKIVTHVLEDSIEELKNASKNLDSVDKALAKSVYLAWKSLEPYALSLSNLVQYTKIDTRKQGNTFIDMRRYELGYNQLVDPPRNALGEPATLFDMDSINRLVTGSWIDAKTKSAVNIPFLILANQTFYANERFMHAAFDYATYFTNASIPSADLLKSIATAMETAVSSKFFSQWMKQYNIDPHSLFYGKWPVAKTLNLLRSRIQSGDATYAHLKNNLLLNQLLIETQSDDYMYNGTTYRGIPFIRISRNIDNSRMDAEALQQAWADLLSDVNPKVRKFAQQLVAYAFITSGAYGGWNKLFKHVPYEWRAGMSPDSVVGGQSYGDFIAEQLASGEFFSEELLYDMVSNNFLEYSMVKRDALKDADGKPKYITVNNPKDPDSPNVIARAYDTDALGDYVVPKFVAVRKQNKYPNQQLQYDLYVCVSDTNLARKEKDHMKDYERGAFYIKMPTKGYHVKRGYDIYEYGVDCNIAENNSNVVSIEELNGAIKQIRNYLDKAYYETGTYDINLLANSDEFSEMLQLKYSEYTTKPEVVTQPTAQKAQSTLTQTETKPQASLVIQAAGEQRIIDDIAKAFGISHEDAKEMYEKGKENRTKCKGE